jgi:hypothetical protein
MSRSYKKAIFKDKPRNYKASTYYRRVRSVIKNIIRSCKDIDSLELPNSKVLVNQYDYCDYKFDFENRSVTEYEKNQKEKYRRK